MPFAAIILAGGKGTRMGGDIPKVCHEVWGKPMIIHVLEAVCALDPEKIVVVVGHQAERVAGAINAWGKRDIEYAYQKIQRGTAHAVAVGLNKFKDFEGNILVRYGDTPLIGSGTLRRLIASFHKSSVKATLLSAYVPDPSGYGRILRGSGGLVECIIEDRNVNEAQKSIKEINAGAYYFDKASLWRAVRKVKLNPVNNEYYLTDVVRVLFEEGHSVEAVPANSYEEIIGINTKAHLAVAERSFGGEFIPKI